jgi:hypothetical protein
MLNMWRVRAQLFAAAVAISTVALWAAPVRADDQAQALLANHHAFVGRQLADGTLGKLTLGPIVYTAVDCLRVDKAGDRG